jgi:hypothetical protein
MESLSASIAAVRAEVAEHGGLTEGETFRQQLRLWEVEARNMEERLRALANGRPHVPFAAPIDGGASCR